MFQAGSEDRGCVKLKSSYSFITNQWQKLENGFLWQVILNICCQKCFVGRIKTPCCALLADSGISLSSQCSWVRGLQAVITITVSLFCFSSLPPSSSVEALASALVPVAVDHQADDDEEDATQHGEEHGEENSDATHPFFNLTQSE